MNTLVSQERAAIERVAADQLVTIARGDGIGPEIMDAALRILDVAGARIRTEEVLIGESVYLAGHSAGIEQSAWDSLQRSRVFLKAPIATPQGGGFKSLNVTVRKTLGLFANVRPCVAYPPFVPTRHPAMDVVIVRENEEDLYAGIEHRQSTDVIQCLKLISLPGCERIVRYAFEYARRNGRRKVSCMTKDNIMKLTDGLFHQVFDRIAADYPDIVSEHWIVDIGAAMLADHPERFDVVVLPNLYGDILSDIGAQIAGSVGMAGSANIGEQVAMFEAIHGTAPNLAGKDMANPSGLINASVMMLNHLGQHGVATVIHNAWLATIEDGVHTADIFDAAVSTRKVGTRDFADAVVARLGARPRRLAAVDYTAAGDGNGLYTPMAYRRPEVVKELVGIDVFLDWSGSQPEALAETINRIIRRPLALQVITNRGVKVWPGGLPETFCTDHWRCRFVAADPDVGTLGHKDLLHLLEALAAAGLDFVKTEHLYRFDGKAGYSLAQGQ